MTCSQCHTRDFGVRSFTDPASNSPKGGVPTIMNGDVRTTNFVIVPTDRWNAYTLEFQKAQQCLAKQRMEEALGKTVAGLSCPLVKQ